MGELHLEVIVDRMMREFRVDANVGRPQVAYKETITVPGTRGGSTRSADRWRRSVRPLRGRVCSAGARSGLRIRGQDRRWFHSSRVHCADRRGYREAMAGGGDAGYPIVDIKATLVDGSYHDVDSKEVAYKIAGSLALKEAVRRGKPVILEPIMEVEVTTPEDFMGDVIGDLNVATWPGWRHGNAGRVRRLFGRTCRWQTCLGMRRICAQARRDARCTRWSFPSYYRPFRQSRRGNDGEGASGLDTIREVARTGRVARLFRTTGSRTIGEEMTWESRNSSGRSRI